jgi:hypothetical protein
LDASRTSGGILHIIVTFHLMVSSGYVCDAVMDCAGKKIERASKKRRTDSGALAFINRYKHIARKTTLIYFVFGSERDRVSNAIWGIDMRLVENDLAIPDISPIFIVAEYVYGPHGRFTSGSMTPTAPTTATRTTPDGPLSFCLET